MLTSDDLEEALRGLYAERERINRAIAEVAAAARQARGPVKRGRKGMNPEERLEVSTRMRRYWEGRRRSKIEASHGA